MPKPTSPRPSDQKSSVGFEVLREVLDVVFSAVGRSLQLAGLYRSPVRMATSWGVICSRLGVPSVTRRTKPARAGRGW
jgi:hypothetical protein